MSAAAKFDEHASAAIGWMTLAAFARDVLATKSKYPGRAGRDWCQANGVPYKRNGKTNWVRIADLRKFFEAPAIPASVPSMKSWG